MIIIFKFDLVNFFFLKMKRYSIEEIYPKSQMGKCMIYFNMSHHYRRIYSAKPRVDTNLSKKTQPQICCSSPDVYNFIRRNCVRRPITITPRHKVCVKEEEEHAPFKPKILHYRAESKLRSLPVYQPPQKIVHAKESTNENAKVPKVKDKVKDSEVNNNECSQTPENHIPETKEEDSSHKQTNTKEKSEPDIKMCEPATDNQEESRYRPLDKSTVMFLKDITDDILRKGIYTNKSLEKLFSHHIQKNKHSLPQDLMEKEVARLKLELEMPLEDEKTTSESTVEDEEVLTALDSLLLPADIRDQVASSLGLKRKPPPLPSPKDSFTGSLALTSMSEGQDKFAKNDFTGTYTLKTDEINEKLEENKDFEGDMPKPSDEEIHQELKVSLSDNDETVADEEYPEDVNSEHTSNVQDVVSEHSNKTIDIKTEDKESDNEEESDASEIKSEAKSTSENSNESASNVSEVKSNTKNEETDQGQSNEEDDGKTSESESIHTEQE